MASSVREQILARVQAAIVASAAVAATSVFRAREVSITRAVSPAVVIMEQTNDPQEFGQSVDRNTLVVAIEIFVRGDPWSTLADPIAIAVHKAVMADAQLLALAARVRQAPAVWNGEEADRTAGTLTATYRVEYLTLATDISAAP